MKYTSLFLVLLGLIFPRASIGENLNCKEAHQEALNLCTLYQSQLGLEGFSLLSYESKIRAAVREKGRTLFMGRRCARAQMRCSRLCADTVGDKIASGQDWATPLDFASDCREGSVAQHKAKMLERYRAFSKLSAQPSLANRTICSVD
jgi:hypothetical protein